MVITETIAGNVSFPDAPSYANNWEFQYLNVKNAAGFYPFAMDSIAFQTSHPGRDYVLTILNGATVLSTKTVNPTSSSILFTSLNVALLPDVNYTIKLYSSSGGQVSYYQSNVYANSYLILNSVAYPAWDMAFNMIGRYDFIAPSKTKILSIY